MHKALKSLKCVMRYGLLHLLHRVLFSLQSESQRIKWFDDHPLFFVIFVCMLQFILFYRCWLLFSFSSISSFSSLSLFFDKQIDDHRKLHVAWDLIFTVPWATILSKNCIISDTCIVNTLDGCYNCNGYSFFLSFIAGSSIAWSSNLNKHNGIVPFEDTHTHTQNNKYMGD